MARSQVLGGVLLPAAVLLALILLALGGDDPVVPLALMAVAPALAAIVAPTVVAAIVSGLTVLVAAITAGATFGLRFGDALSALVWVIAVSAVAVVLASLRPKIVVHPRTPAPVQPPEPVAPDLLDPITGLPTRAAVLASHVTPVEGEPRLLALLDIDDLAGINDEHGHGIGDTLLFAVGGRTRYALDELARPQDQIVARWGDDEFVVVILGIDAEAQAALEWIVRKVNDNPIRTDSGLVEATLSAGAVAWRAGESLVDATRRARQQLHRAKAAGRGELVMDLTVDR